MSDKSTIRAAMLAKRQAVDATYAQEAALALAENLLNLLTDKTKIIAAYIPMRGEIDVMPLLDRLSAQGYRLCLPYINPSPSGDRELAFRAWQPGIELAKGIHGTREPMAAAPELIPDIVIVPLLAFDAHGHRLGYGAGYYDRALESLRLQNKNLLAIGAAYAMQQVDHLPAENHDEKLNVVVTEKGIIHIG